MLAPFLVSSPKTPSSFPLPKPLPPSHLPLLTNPPTSNSWLWHILISLYKAQVQVDQGPPHKTRYTETNRRESRGKPRTHGHSGKFPEQNTNGLCSKINNGKMDFITLQSFCKAKDNVNRTKWQPTDWERDFTNPTSDRELISNICKELKTLKHQRIK